LNALQAKCFAHKGQSVINKIVALPIPVIAAVNGYALGGGLEIALACDFIYATESANLGLPETTLGLIPGFGGTQRLPRLVGPSQAKELIYTGKIISAAEAQATGMVNRVCASGALMEAVTETARTMAARGRISLRAAKEAVNNGLDTNLGTGLKIEQDAFAICMVSEDAREGTRAFIEKRPPVFKGHLKSEKSI
jgi:enoyl-CoA hydratase